MLLLQPALTEPRPPEPKAWGLSLVFRPCSSEAERSPCKRQVAGAIPRLGLQFSVAPAEIVAAIFAHVAYWMGDVLLKRFKQVRFLPCVWCAIAQLVERPPVKWIVPGSSPGSAAFFHYRLTVRHSAHDWTVECAPYRCRRFVWNSGPWGQTLC